MSVNHAAPAVAGLGHNSEGRNTSAPAPKSDFQVAVEAILVEYSGIKKTAMAALKPYELERLGLLERSYARLLDRRVRDQAEAGYDLGRCFEEAKSEVLASGEAALMVQRISTSVSKDFGLRLKPETP